MFPLLIPLLGAVPHIVAGVEAMFGRGNGTTKKKPVALGILGDFVNGITADTGTTGANSAMMEFLSEVIDSTVKLANATGQFKHGSV